MTFTYPCAVFRTQYGYNIAFPDLDNLACTGENLDYALNFAKEDLKSYLIEQIEDHQTLPKPTSLADFDVEAYANSLSVDFKIESMSKQDITVDL